MTTKTLNLTEAQFHDLSQALLAETTRLADVADKLSGHEDSLATELRASVERCRKSNEYLRGLVDGTLTQF